MRHQESIISTRPTMNSSSRWTPIVQSEECVTRPEEDEAHIFARTEKHHIAY